MSTPSELRVVAETLMMPLYGRAVETAKPAGLLSDPKAVEMIEAIDYDFTRFRGDRSVYGAVLRTAVFDHWVRDFLHRHPAGTVFEVGGGLNTRYERLDNGTAHWVDLDLPEATALRRRFFTDTDRRRMIAASVLDGSWATGRAAARCRRAPALPRWGRSPASTRRRTPRTPCPPARPGARPRPAGRWRGSSSPAGRRWP